LTRTPKTVPENASSTDDMKELFNFTVWQASRFENDWTSIEGYIDHHGVDGIELLISGTGPPPAAIPKDKIVGVHLPFWITWLDIWKQVPDAVSRYYPEMDTGLVPQFCGGADPGSMVKAQKTIWKYAAALDPDYAVLHVCHVEVPHIFTLDYPYSNREVIEAQLDLIEQAALSFEDGEPPVKLAFENLWWPGLTFLNPDLMELFFEKLSFNNWCFLLDTGHLMNTNLDLETEDQAIDYVLKVLNNLPSKMLERIEIIQLHCNLTGNYRKQLIQGGLPKAFMSLPFLKRFDLAKDLVAQIDSHHPFTHPRAQEIIALVNPAILTHELLSKSTKDFDDKLRTQRHALSKSPVAK